MLPRQMLLSRHVLVHHLSALRRPLAVPICNHPMREMLERISFRQSLHLAVNTCLLELALPHPPLLTNRQLNNSHLRAKLSEIVHASQNLVNERRYSKYRLRKSLLRLISRVLLPRHPPTTLYCFVVVCDPHDPQSQQMHVKHRNSGAHPTNQPRHSIAALSISRFQASRPMWKTTRIPVSPNNRCST